MFRDFDEQDWDMWPGCNDSSPRVGWFADVVVVIDGLDILLGIHHTDKPTAFFTHVKGPRRREGELAQIALHLRPHDEGLAERLAVLGFEAI